jgi:Reverse transcriptase (RNA-dependent DNA polymerase)
MAAAQAEVSGLESKHTWEEVPMSDAKSKIISGTWVLRIKRSSAGEIKKFKARYCVRGDLEEEDDEDNFAPVVAWSTVRLFLVLCYILRWWSTASLDFTNAFVQSILTSHGIYIGFKKRKKIDDESNPQEDY